MAKGKIVTIWLDEEHLKMWKDLRNKSAFVQLCLEQRVGIMAWDILKKRAPEKYQDVEHPVEETVEEYNARHPLDPLTQARINKEEKETDPWPKNSPNNQEIW